MARAFLPAQKGLNLHGLTLVVLLEGGNGAAVGGLQDELVSPRHAALLLLGA